MTEPRRVGRYALFGEIAAGGMATVHLGRLLGAVGFSRTVAIKRLHPHHARDPDFVRMFIDEARLAARIRHPNVVPTLDVVSMQGELFLVMEYVHGESMSKAIRAVAAAGGRIPIPILSAVVTGTLHGLHAAHEARDEKGQPMGLVHRDVSPHNVLIGVDGMARVVDFGVAKAASRFQDTADGQVKGKISYMAPEQLDCGEVSRAADIYAVGVVLWESLTGTRLFDGTMEQILTARVRNKVAPSVREKNPMVPPGLEVLVAKSLSYEPQQRFATARDMALALERAVPPASPAEVGEWLEGVARETLAERAQVLEHIDAISSTLDDGSGLASAVDDQGFGGLLLPTLDRSDTHRRRGSDDPTSIESRRTGSRSSASRPPPESFDRDPLEHGSATHVGTMSVGMDSRRFADAPPPVSKMALAGLFVSVVACLLSFSIWMSTKSTRGTDADDQKTQATNHDNPAQEERQEVTEPTEARAPADTPTSAPAAVPAEPALAREPTTRYGRGVFGDQEAVGAVEGSPMQSQQTVRSNPRRESNSAPASEPKKSRSPANSQTPAKKPKSSERGSSSQFDLFGGRD